MPIPVRYYWKSLPIFQAAKSCFTFGPTVTNSQLGYTLIIAISLIMTNVKLTTTFKTELHTLKI
jgi:hypothetical protein